MDPRSYSLPPIISVVGDSGSGKTSLIEKTVEELTARGYRIGVVKHHVHGGFDVDKPGKDTWRIAQAGASAVALVAPNKMFVVQNTANELSLSEVVHMMTDIDLVFTEGFRREAHAKIMVVGNEIDGAIPTVSDEIVAVVTDGKADLGAESIDSKDYTTLCNVIEKRFLRN